MMQIQSLEEHLADSQHSMHLLFLRPEGRGSLRSGAQPGACPHGQALIHIWASEDALPAPRLGVLLVPFPAPSPLSLLRTRPGTLAP